MNMIPEDKRDPPIFATSDVPPSPDISKLYLIDMDNLEIPYCDCVLYDRNGNPNCPIHRGKLQTFYDPSDVIQIGPKGKKHLEVDGNPSCNFRSVMGQKRIKTKGYITCKNCLHMELVAKRRLIEAHKLINKEEGVVFKMEGIETKGEIKDLK